MAFFSLIATLLLIAYLNSMTIVRFVLAFPYRMRLVLFRMILYTSSLIHEGLHFLACLLTFTRVYRFSLGRLTEDGFTPGYVEHQNKGFIRNFLISLAPIFGSITILVLPFLLLRETLQPAFILNPSGNGFSFSIKIFTSSLKTYPPWVFLLIGFMMVFISYAILPSATDLRNALASLLVMIVPFSLLYALSPEGVAEVFREALPGIAIASTYILLLIALNVSILVFQLLILLILWMFRKSKS